MVHSLVCFTDAKFCQLFGLTVPQPKLCADSDEVLLGLLIIFVNIEFKDRLKNSVQIKDQVKACGQLLVFFHFLQCQVEPLVRLGPFKESDEPGNYDDGYKYVWLPVQIECKH